MSQDSSQPPDGRSPGKAGGVDPAIGPLDEVIANLDLEAPPSSSDDDVHEIDLDACAGDTLEDVVVLFEETQRVETEPAQASTEPPQASTEPPPVSPPPAALDEGISREHYLRLHADFENLRKRLERERNDLYLHATSSLTSRLLPVLDNFERAISAGRQPGGIEALLEGVELVHRQLIEELRQEGLRDIDALGLAFDPEVHEAVASDSSSSAPPNSVIAVMRRGYFFHDRVLRAALVCVSTEPEPPIERDDRRED